MTNDHLIGRMFDCDNADFFLSYSDLVNGKWSFLNNNKLKLE